MSVEFDVPLDPLALDDYEKWALQARPSARPTLRDQDLLVLVAALCREVRSLRELNKEQGKHLRDWINRYGSLEELP